MECEVCGKTIYGGGRRVTIDGAKLVICSRCARSTKPALQTYKWQPTEVKKVPSTAKTPQRRITTRKNVATIREELELVENYGALLREARERMSLTHDELSKKIGVKVSVLQKLETEKMVPDQEVIKKLERSLKIRLLQPIPRIPVEKEFTKQPEDLTLGDLVFVQDENKSKVRKS
jgi:putative transcription factor